MRNTKELPGKEQVMIESIGSEIRKALQEEPRRKGEWQVWQLTQAVAGEVAVMPLGAGGVAIKITLHETGKSLQVTFAEDFQQPECELEEGDELLDAMFAEKQQRDGLTVEWIVAAVHDLQSGKSVGELRIFHSTRSILTNGIDLSGLAGKLGLQK